MKRFWQVVTHSANVVTLAQVLLSLAAAIGATQYVKDKTNVGSWSHPYAIALLLFVFAVALLGLRFLTLRTGIAAALEPPPPRKQAVTIGDLIDAQKAAKELIGVEQKEKQVRVSAQKIRTELATCKRMLNEALRIHRHWDPYETGLPAGEWNARSDALAAEPELGEAYAACREAYIECDWTNKDNKTHWDNTRRNFYDPTPEQYSNAVAKIADAEAKLDAYLAGKK